MFYIYEHKDTVYSSVDNCYEVSPILQKPTIHKSWQASIASQTPTHTVLNNLSMRQPGFHSNQSGKLRPFNVNFKTHLKMEEMEQVQERVEEQANETKR